MTNQSTRPCDAHWRRRLSTKDLPKDGDPLSAPSGPTDAMRCVAPLPKPPLSRVPTPTGFVHPHGDSRYPCIRRRSQPAIPLAESSCDDVPAVIIQQRRRVGILPTIATHRRCASNHRYNNSAGDFIATDIQAPCSRREARPTGYPGAMLRFRICCGATCNSNRRRVDFADTVREFHRRIVRQSRKDLCQIYRTHSCYWLPWLFVAEQHI
jgi:hypothetical protein